MDDKIVVNKEYELSGETLETIAGGLPFPSEWKQKKNNQECPKCGVRKQIAVGKQIEGLGLRLVTNCWECNLHWLSEDFYGNAEVTYTYVDGPFGTDEPLHVIPKPF